MTKDYQPKKTKYILPQGIYMSTLWIIRDYARMKESIEDEILTTPVHDGMPRGSGISDPTANKAMNLSAWRMEQYTVSDAISAGCSQADIFPV